MALIENLNLSDKVTQELGRAIISGEYSNDSGFPSEAKMCEDYGVSRTSIREAVKMLGAKGLITSRPRKGIVVEPASKWNLYDTSVLKWMLESSPSLFVLREFLQMRMAIEPQAAALAAQFATDEQIKQIEQALKGMEAAGSDPTLSLHEADIAFHTSILAASNNRFILQLRDFVSTALNVSIQHTTPAKGSIKAIIEEHDKVYRAISLRQPERAKSMTAYLIDEAIIFIDAEIAKQEQK
ncbi:MAG: FadR family transcriptional regulator [Paraglaciecola sp.]|jgi:DNA-binding FadR family transcriptional regulator|uniref:FadR/GntR family transcriptional regulator n=1 Tax=Pseudomonadati TaxID=3379134 RepID=UPI00273E0E6A|nr:FadR/GntR family transcriptional regulator [Paraglaciecola sp.]MDP5029699.1 FadR family transcriptional regulator [Paraglaciecola sp.]MDP5129986.1 FadR family transcriptional regulator [Paraglaciecola sp.]